MFIHQEILFGSSKIMLKNMIIKFLYKLEEFVQKMLLLKQKGEKNQHFDMHLIFLV